jgi:transposase
MDREGVILGRRSLKTSELNLRAAFSQLRQEVKGELHVHLEAGELAGWAREAIAPLVTRVIIGDPRRSAWIANDPCKNDRLDAFKLADLLRMNRVHEVYYDDAKPRRVFKQVVQHYEDLTREQAALKVKIKARLRVQGLIRKDTRVFASDGREAILNQIADRQLRAIIKQLYDLLEAIRAQQRAALLTMREMSRQFPEIALLKETPGVKLINACRFSAYVQNPHRFSNLRAFWRYARLGVTQQSSDGKPIGPQHLDRAGCGSLKDVSRKTFEAALRRSDNNLFKRAYEQSLARTKDATHARLSVQRKILAVMRAVWMTGQPYRDELGRKSARLDHNSLGRRVEPCLRQQVDKR